MENECCEWGPCLYTPVYYLFYSIRTLESYGKDPMEILFQRGGGGGGGGKRSHAYPLKKETCE